MDSQRENYKTNVSGISKISETAYLIRIQYPWAWQPGDVTGIKLLEHEPPRLYSIAGSDSKNEITLLFTEKPDGLLTPRLSEVKKGDKIFASKPFGKFRPGSLNSWWICNGTGIAPFRGVWRNEELHNITLLHGVRNSEDKYFSEEINTQHEIEYTACLSRENSEQDFHGRITKYLESKEHFPVDTNFYLCGSTEMIVEVRDLLISKGIPFTNIYTEIYF